METIYNSKDILAILPHRYPFILVDRIVECNDKDWIVGIKNVSANEPFSQGHFPGHADLSRASCNSRRWPRRRASC